MRRASAGDRRLLDRLRLRRPKTVPYVESDAPSPIWVYGRTKLLGRRQRARTPGSCALVALRPVGHNFVRTMLRLGAERDEVAIVADQRGSPTYIGHLAEAVERSSPCRSASSTSPPGECTWADFAEAIFEEAGLASRVRRISTADSRPAAEPAYSVLRTERPGAPALPHWRDGLRACLDRLT